MKTWNRVKAPKIWRPKDGDALIGTYLGSQIRSGVYGDYNAHFIKHNHRVFMVSGSQLDSLIALIGKGEQIKLVYVGRKVSHSSGNEYKAFELYSENVVEFRLVG